MFFICILIMTMDVTAGVLGIEAELAENKHQSFKAFKLGVAATVLLGLAHVIANVLGGCICVCSNADLKEASANKQLSTVFLIFSWITLAVGLMTLIAGTLANSKSRKYHGIPHHRLLCIGGILCFFHGLFSVAYYVSAKATAKEEKRSLQPQGIHV